MHDVGAQRACEADEERGVGITGRRQAYRGHRQRVVEVDGIPGWIVEADERHVEAALCERGKEREQVALGAADAAHAVDVDDPHLRATLRRPAAARTASRKSHGTR